MKNSVKIIFILLLPLLSHAQTWSIKRQNKNYMLEVGNAFGLSNYIGDLTPTNYQLKFYHYANSMYIKYYPGTRFVDFTASLNYLKISADDAKSTPQRQIRNLSFKTNVLEFNTCVEINLIGFQPILHNHQFSPYLFFGVGIFHFNPKAYYEGKWYALQPLGTEGQGLPGYDKKYNRIQLCIPFGGGLKYGFNVMKEDYVSISAELNLRKTFTDYLDDVSKEYVPLSELKKYNGDMSAQLSIRTEETPNSPYYGATDIDSGFDIRRGSPNIKDYYFVANIGIAYIIHHEEYKYVYHKKNKSKKIDDRK